MIRIVLDGEPVAKGRARMTKTGHAYTPSKTRSYEAVGRVMAQGAMEGLTPLTGPVSVSVVALFPVPRSWSKTKRAAAMIGAMPHTSRPDLDNVQKIVLDFCNGVVFVDDSQVVEMTARKRYSEKPQIIVEITSL